MRAFEASSPDALILLQKVADPQSYGIAELDGDGRVSRLVEKPAEPRSDLALVGVYLFTPAVFESVKAIKPSARGELEITDAIQHMVDRGLRVEPHVVTGWWKDTGKLEDMLEANRLVLSTLVGDVRGELCETTLEGPVRIGRRQPARALHRARPRRHRRRLPAQRHLRRPVHVHQRRRGRRPRRARALDRPREQPHLAPAARAWPTA